jgi:anti-anti-sigma regulatory factor
MEIADEVHIKLDGDYGISRVKELVRALAPAIRSHHATLDLCKASFSHSSAFSVLIATRIKMLNERGVSTMRLAGLSEAIRRQLNISKTGGLFSLDVDAGALRL